jgi:5S rRNA maturation endonuclease (ribonuclease M5)
MTPEKKSSFIKVDELMPKVSLEQVAAYYGVQLPDLHRTANETRTRCFLICGRTQETGDRALAIQTDDPARKWHCHQYGCGKGGNLISLCDLLKPGTNAGGRPRGQRFKEIAADLQAIASGASRAEGAAAAPAKPPSAEAPKVNLPLAESPNERARGLVNLDQKFVLDIAAMPPKASAYFRRRLFLTPEVCKKWRVGYLPRDAGGEDKSGGTMRGKIVYGYQSEGAELLTWFGRDPEFEDKHQKWVGGGKQGQEPEKFHFVKGFHRGIELLGQHALRFPEATEKLKGLGLIVVEGPNDVIRLDTLGVPAVALCSNRISREQATKAARLARKLAGGIVTVMLDCDAEGEEGMKQCLGYLAQLCPIRLAWTSKMYGGKFRGTQPESLKAEQWEEILDYLLSGAAKDVGLTAR